MQTRVSQIDGKSIAQDSQHRDRLSGARPNRSKAVPGEASGHHKSTENRSPPRTAGGAQEHSRSYFGASWQRLGTSPARPGSAQGRPRPEPKASARERLGARRDNQNRCQVASGSEKSLFFLAQLVREAFSGQFFDDFGSFFAVTFVIFCGDIARASRLAARRANVAISLVFCS